ncbi:MAG: hypothetical protein KJO79_03070 [Verrucomicrobiae bacterium]|nr:hypothetical protein [Verrucomicrobiae bacterium]NNJ86137.1 hypothetical protein [Akkermansiaceae bacterium]
MHASTVIDGNAGGSPGTLPEDHEPRSMRMDRKANGVEESAQGTSRFSHSPAIATGDHMVDYARILKASGSSHDFIYQCEQLNPRGLTPLHVIVEWYHHVTNIHQVVNVIHFKSRKECHNALRIQ